MNNNRNNRRRGRGNRSNQGGGNNQNRIDSRARGNAPQLLDKYKKLAQDAQHNGDRVQAEYYLQFADHYFRVIADNKARQDEARAKRNEERGANNDDRDEDDGEGRRRGNRRGRGRRDNQEGDSQDDNAVTTSADQGETGVEGEPASADEENAKPKRRARKPREEGSDETPRRRTRRKKTEDAEDTGEIDSSILPPAISASAGSEDDDGLEAVG
ncbi:DUF4167 domain-containing protein [uncultured Erythrobacter sp.]|uniref:DUF4167 domain-containing protein n=1 Tax=uncultured Erythrobacter sp. TaxID=263913 RepID=UPI0026029BD1|nr:DUF4167 domain-containing protein [uncultured Erythrobacter sp.]